MFAFVTNIAPIYPVYMYDLDGNRMTDDNGKALYDYGNSKMPGTTGRAYSSNQNPIAAAKDDKNEIKEDNFNGRGFAEISFLNDFKFTTNLGYDARNNYVDIFYNALYGDSEDHGRIQKYSRRYETVTANQLLNYNKTFDKVHNLAVLVGHESYEYNSKTIYAEKQDVQLPNIGLDEFNNAITMTAMESYQNKKSIESYLSQLLYDFDNKYYFSGSFRRDGSSIFHKDNRWGNFWSIGGSWRVSQEEFMQSFEWVNNLRLRASYGTQGNDAILDTDGYVVYLPYERQYTIDPTGGKSPSYKGNKDIKWEVNKNFNIGLDFTAFDNRLNVEFDYFIRKSSDLLYNKPLPVSEGFAFEPQNIGDMKNTGIEFTISGDVIKTPEFRWNVVFNGTHYKNEITKLPLDPIVETNTIKTVGKSVYEFYLLDYAGVDPTNGNALWYYTDKVTGERLKTNDASFAMNNEGRVIAGSAIPDFTGSLNMTFEYKRFDLSIMTNFQIGGKVLDQSYRNLMHGGNAGTNWHKDILNAWTPANTNTDVPRLGTTYTDANYLQSNRFLVDASYFNFKNVTLGYTFDSKVLNYLKLSGLRVYFSGDNLGILTKRKGFDPRQALSAGVTDRNSVSGRSDYGYTPISSYSLGLTVNF